MFTLNRPVDRPAQASAHTWMLCHGPRTLVTVIQTDGLWRVLWPDTGRASPPANLARCMEAAERWAEQRALTDLRKKRGVGALKSHNFFSWSRSPMRANGRGSDIFMNTRWGGRQRPHFIIKRWIAFEDQQVLPATPPKALPPTVEATLDTFATGTKARPKTVSEPSAGEEMNDSIPSIGMGRPS
jgi:hypothetical protein